MRAQFYHDYKADLIFHLKQGPVSLTKNTIESLYLDSVPYGVSFRLGPLWVQRYPLGVKNSNDLLLAVDEPVCIECGNPYVPNWDIHTCDACMTEYWHRHPEPLDIAEREEREAEDFGLEDYYDYGT